MSADTAPPVRDWADDAITLAMEVENHAWDLPAIRSAPGYRPLPQTESDCEHLVRLLEEARELMVRSIERKCLRFGDHCLDLEARGVKF